MNDDITSSGQDAAAVAHGAAVIVTYNGLQREIEFQQKDLVADIRSRAIAEFGITQNPHLLGLFNESGVELSDNQTAHDAGVRPHDQLLLRPSAVRGGDGA